MVPRTPSPLDMMEDVMQTVFDDKDTVMMPSPLLLLAAVILVFGVSSAALAFRCLLIILILIHICVMGDDLGKEHNRLPVRTYSQYPTFDRRSTCPR
jgi:hypothetical protein